MASDIVVERPLVLSVALSERDSRALYDRQQKHADEIASLRARMEELQEAQVHVPELEAAEIASLRARVAELEAALREIALPTYVAAVGESFEALANRFGKLFIRHQNIARRALGDGA